MSAAALAINQLLFHGSGIGPGPIVGIASLVVQAVTIALVLGRNKLGRVLVVFFLVLAALPLPLAARLIVDGSRIAAANLVISFLLKAAATVLLFMEESRRWFSAGD
jgi:hypothetical protein